MKLGVRVMPKTEVLDSQGRAVEKTLSHHGKMVESCRVGRYIELSIDEGDKNRAMAKAQEIAEFVLYNPLTEMYEIEFL